MRNVHIANAIATIVSAFAVVVLSDHILLMFMTMQGGNANVYRFCSLASAAIIMSRHISPLKNLWIHSKT
jgi:hypothetical protein